MRLTPGLRAAFAGVGAGLALTSISLHSTEPMAAIPPSGYSSLKVDLGPEEQRVQPGWVRWSGDRDRDFSTDFDDDFEIEIDRGHAWRDRGGTEEGQSMSLVLRDGLRERDDNGIRLNFKRLDPGDYVLELFSCDLGEEVKAAVGHFEIMIDGRIIFAGLFTMGRTSRAGAALPPISFASRGEKIVVVMKRLDGEIWLNGFILSRTVRDSRAGDHSEGFD